MTEATPTSSTSGLPLFENISEDERTIFDFMARQFNPVFSDAAESYEWHRKEFKSRNKGDEVSDERLSSAYLTLLNALNMTAGQRPDFEGVMGDVRTPGCVVNL